jgi:hypothetical protein
VFLVFRSVVCLYTGVLLVYTCGFTSGGEHNTIVYLTTWTYLVLSLHFLVAAIVAWYCYLRSRGRTGSGSEAATRVRVTTLGTGFGNPIYTLEPNSSTNTDLKVLQSNDIIQNGGLSSQDDITSSTGQADTNVPLTWYMKLSWLLSDIVSVFALVVSILYFGTIFPFTGYNEAPVSDLNRHAVNSVLICLDVAVSARPVRLLHFIYPTIYGGLYITFSAIYWASDHTNVLYGALLDWNAPGIPIAMVFGLALVVVPLLQLLLFGLFRLRLLIYSHIYKKDNL